MAAIRATEFCRNFGLYQREVRKEPIEVTSHGRTTGFFISPEDFEKYRRLLAASSQAIHPSELSDDLRDALANSSMSPEHGSLDRLMDPE